MDSQQREERLRKLEKLLIPEAKREMGETVAKEYSKYVLAAKKHYSFVLEYNDLLHQKSLDQFRQVGLSQ